MPTGETAFDAALLAMASKQSGKKVAEATLARARLLAAKQPNDSLLQELLRLAAK